MRLPLEDNGPLRALGVTFPVMNALENTLRICENRLVRAWGATGNADQRRLGRAENRG